MNIGEEELDCLNITLEDSLDFEERLIADHKPYQIVVKEVFRSAWNKMGVARVLRAKANVFAIIVGEEAVARRLMKGNLWFIRDYIFLMKLWPTCHSLDEIEANKAIYWIQAHGIPMNYCTVKNARCLRARMGAVLELKDLTSFRGFLRMRVDFDATKSLLTSFSVPCPRLGSYNIRLYYEGLQIFCYKCGRLDHSSGCPRPALG
ncbi:unnamed protein product [Malus baccata var. baccata]